MSKKAKSILTPEQIAAIWENVVMPDHILGRETQNANLDNFVQIMVQGGRLSISDGAHRFTKLLEAVQQLRGKKLN